MNAKSLATWSASKRRRFLASLTPDEKAVLNYHWPFWAREKQLPPAEPWRVWLLMSGRGFGKTRTAAEWVRAETEAGTRRRWAFVHRTAADVRDVMIEGESGILAVSPPWNRPRYEPSKRRLTWPSGAVATLYSAEEPDLLRGPEHDGAWCEELATWDDEEAWDNLMFGLRLGEDPRAVVTTTPKPRPLLRRVLKLPHLHVTRGTTYENLENLAPAFASEIVARYEGTRLGRQEILGELLEDVVGALWTRDGLERTRVTRPPDLVRVVVAVDPEATSGEDSAETGIVVAGRGADGHGYVLADCSIRGTPDQWGRAAVAAYHAWGADRLCGEVNNGGEMVGHVIRTVDPTVAYKALHASHGKTARAEPVAALYEQGRGHMVGFFPDLEDQLCSWVAGDKSPDRLDALVWSLTELLLDSQYGSIPMASADSLPEGWAGIIKRAAAGDVPGVEPEDDETSVQHQAALARILNRLQGLTGGNPF